MILFAYRSDLSPTEMAQRCPGYRSLGVARLAGHRLCFPRFSRHSRCATAGLEPSAGHMVWGALYEISPHDLPVLHYHEGYNPDGPAAQNEHDFREITVVRLGGAEQVQAMTYVPIPDGTASLPSRAYVDAMIDGATYHGLPKTWLVVLQAVRTG